MSVLQGGAQGAAVEFEVGIARQVVQPDPKPWLFIARQMGVGMGGKRRLFGRAQIGAGQNSGARGNLNLGHGAVGQAGTGGHGRLNLLRSDAKATGVQNVIGPAQMAQSALGGFLNQIAGHEPVTLKAAGGFSISPQIAKHQSRIAAMNRQNAGLALGQGRAIGIQNRNPAARLCKA